MIKCLVCCLYHLVAINVKKVEQEEEQEEEDEKALKNTVSSAQRDLGQHYPCLVDHTVSVLLLRILAEMYYLEHSCYLVACTSNNDKMRYF